MAWCLCEARPPASRSCLVGLPGACFALHAVLSNVAQIIGNSSLENPPVQTRQAQCGYAFVADSKVPASDAWQRLCAWQTKQVYSAAQLSSCRLRFSSPALYLVHLHPQTTLDCGRRSGLAGGAAEQQRAVSFSAQLKNCPSSRM